MPRKESLITLAMVIGFFLIMTRIDYVVNCILYEHGLKFSEVWHSEWTYIYILAYVFFAVVMGYFNKSLKLGLSLLVISLISTQDIFYFLVWNVGNRFPTSMWVWMYQYRIFGYWNMATQLLLSVFVISAFLVANKIWKRKRDFSIKFPQKGGINKFGIRNADRESFGLHGSPPQRLTNICDRCE